VKPVISMAALADGEMIACDVEGVDVLLCRVDGQHYAVSNHCSHARQALATGKLKGYEISCPLHGARFDVRDGRCLAAPASRPIPTFEVTLEAGKVHVTVDPEKDLPPKPSFGPMN
jgi:3-phenylpropionate/trans-cinnamate dioxygenase ferredoxin subunit